jgi:hypothetical protein
LKINKLKIKNAKNNKQKLKIKRIKTEVEISITKWTGM